VDKIVCDYQAYCGCDIQSHRSLTVGTIVCASHNYYWYMVEMESTRGQIPSVCIFGRHI